MLSEFAEFNSEVYIFVFSRFPGDPKLYDVDRQFMLGPALVVTPVLEEGATNVTGIFPKGIWFGVYHVSIHSCHLKAFVKLDDVAH